MNLVLQVAELAHDAIPQRYGLAVLLSKMGDRWNQEIPAIKIQISNKYQWSNLNLQTRPLERRTRGNTLEC